MNFIIALCCLVTNILLVNGGHAPKDVQSRIQGNLASGFGGVVQSLDPLHIGSFHLNSSQLPNHFIVHDANFTGLAEFDRIDTNDLYEDGSFNFQIHVPSIKMVSKMEVIQNQESNDIPSDPTESSFESRTFSVTLNDINIKITGIIDEYYTAISNIDVQIKIGGNATDIEGWISDNSDSTSTSTPNLSQDLAKAFEETSRFYTSEISQFLTEYNDKLIQYQP